MTVKEGYLKRNRLIERRMLIPGRRPDRRIQPVADTYFCKSVEAGGLLPVVLPDTIDEADHALLDQIIAVAASQIIGAGQLTDQLEVSLYQELLRVPVPAVGQGAQPLIGGDFLCRKLGFHNRHAYYTYFPQK